MTKRNAYHDFDFREWLVSEIETRKRVANDYKPFIYMDSARLQYTVECQKFATLERVLTNFDAWRKTKGDA